MHLTPREKQFLREAGNELIFGFGCEDVSFGTEEAKLFIRGTHKGKSFHWELARVDFHYPVGPPKGSGTRFAAKVATEMGLRLSQRGILCV